MGCYCTSLLTNIYIPKTFVYNIRERAVETERSISQIFLFPAFLLSMDAFPFSSRRTVNFKPMPSNN